MASISLDAQSIFDVKGMVVVVTGGGSGVGLMMAQALEANGAIVYIIGRRKESLDKAAATAKHQNIHPIVGDVTDVASLEAAAADIGSSTDGVVNLVVANSGITGPVWEGLPENPDLATYQKQLRAWKTDDFNQTFSTNVTGVFNTVTAFLSLLDAGNKKGDFKQRSQIIATSSIGGYNRIPLAGYAYSASKAAVTQMMKQFSTSLAPYNIRANVIAPGIFPSEMTADMMKSGFPKSRVPEERAGDLEDMAAIILFLASKGGAYVNGNVLVCDGGRLSILPSTY